MCCGFLPTILSAGSFCFWISCLSMFWWTKLVFIADVHLSLFQWIQMSFVLFCFIQEIEGYFRWEGCLGGLQSNFLLKAGSAMRSDHTTQGFFQVGLKNIQEQSQARSGLGMSLPGCPHSGQVSPYTQPERLVAAYACSPLASCQALRHKTWLWKLPGAAATCPEAISSRLKKALPQPPLTRQVLQVSHPAGPLLNSLQLVQTGGRGVVSSN